MKLLGIDLFAGAGGLSIGAKNAGIEITLAVEKDRWAAKTYRFNHPSTAVLEADVRSVALSDSSLISRRGDGLIVIGGPPCSGFSTSNQRTRTKKNPDNWMFIEFLRIVDRLSPDWVVCENVQGMRDTAGGYFYQMVRSELEDLGYYTEADILDSSNFQVPQERRRLFIVGTRHNIKGFLPKPEASPPPTVADALNDLPMLTNGASVCNQRYQKPPCSKYSADLRKGQLSCTNNLVTRSSPEVLERFKYVPPGGNWRNIPDEIFGPVRGRGPHTGVYHRLDPDKPARVIGNFRKNMLIHHRANRGISVREAARLQSFPDEYQFMGSIGFQQQQVGNAVPPLLAEAVFSSILSKMG